jgi:hypothetical protein
MRSKTGSPNFLALNQSFDILWLMGFDLTNDKGEYLRFSPSGWALALTLAESYAWAPAGTTLPTGTEIDGGDWSGEYATNERQCVSAVDAAALAAALTRALASTDYTSRTASIFKSLTDAVDRTIAASAPPRAPFGETEIAKFRKQLEDLIAFSQDAGFVIE